MNPYPKKSSFELLSLALTDRYERVAQEQAAQQAQRAEARRAEDERRQFLRSMPTWKRDAYLRQEAEAAERVQAQQEAA
jgi:hypothetical protein